MKAKLTLCSRIRKLSSINTGIFRYNPLSIKAVILLLACQSHRHSGVAYGRRKKSVATASRSRWRHSMRQTSINQSINLSRMQSNTFLHVGIDFRFHSTVYSLILILDIKFCDCILLQHRVHTEGGHTWMHTMLLVRTHIGIFKKKKHHQSGDRSLYCIAFWILLATGIGSPDGVGHFLTRRHSGAPCKYPLLRYRSISFGHGWRSAIVSLWYPGCLLPQTNARQWVPVMAT